MVILINPRAAGGRALQKWNIIAKKIQPSNDSLVVRIIEEAVDTKTFVRKMLELGQDVFIAAGGDGTVNLLLNYLLTSAPVDLLPKLKLGAIGLGSSNDFHKPFSESVFLESIPLRINTTNTTARDIGRLVYEDAAGHSHVRYWLINASIGVTAQANLFFNSSDRTLELLKRTSSSTAILYAALHTITSFKNLPVRIWTPNFSRSLDVTNLGIAKSPHFSGDLCYDHPFEPSSGTFHIHLCQNMSRLRTLNTLRHLSKKRFCGLPQTCSFVSNQIAIEAEQPFAVEFDGEVIETQHAEFNLLPQRIQICNG